MTPNFMLKKMAVLTSAVQGLAAFFENEIFFLIYTSVNTALTNGTWYLVSQRSTVHITLLVICYGLFLESKCRTDLRNGSSVGVFQLVL